MYQKCARKWFASLGNVYIREKAQQEQIYGRKHLVLRITSTVTFTPFVFQRILVFPSSSLLLWTQCPFAVKVNLMLYDTASPGLFLSERNSFSHSKCDVNQSAGSGNYWEICFRSAS